MYPPPMMVQQPYAPPTYVAIPGDAIYKGRVDLRMLPPQELARLSQHRLTRFPVAATIFLNFITFGIFGWIHFGLMHDKLPQAAHDDPSSGKAIGYQLIPVYGLYWIFFNSLRLTDRLTLQLRLRGLPETGPRGMVMTTCIFHVIPYIGILLAMLIFWPITVGLLQATVNRVASLPGPQTYPQPYPQY